MLSGIAAKIKGAPARLYGSSATVAAMAFVAAISLAPIPARAAEQSLLGIHIYSPARAVLQKLGNPSQVLTGAQSSTTIGGYGGPMGAPGMGPMGRGRGYGGGVGPLPPMGGAPGTMPGEFGGGDAVGGMPGGPPMGMPPGMPMGGPGGYGAPAMFRPPVPGANTAGTESQTYQYQEVHYIYEKPNGLTYDFLISPTGKVIQIAASGYKGAARTSRGIALGSTYGQVLAKYGFPETQRVNGGVVFLSYANRDHVAFQLMDNKVVGIIVAYMK